jgi:hypothetical protein
MVCCAVLLVSFFSLSKFLKGLWSAFLLDILFIFTLQPYSNLYESLWIFFSHLNMAFTISLSFSFLLKNVPNMHKLGSWMIFTTGHHSFKERGLLAQVWKKGKAKVLSIPSFQCKFGPSFFYWYLSLNTCNPPSH